MSARAAGTAALPAFPDKELLRALETQNILGWKGPKAIIKSDSYSRPCTGNNPTLCILGSVV